MCLFFLIMMLPYKILSNRFQGRYQFTGAYLFMFIFSVIEMDKLDKPHNFEPQIYNTERGARDRLIYDYNTMSIRDFNEKYGGLWDFTMKREDMISPWQVTLLKGICLIPSFLFSVVCALYVSFLLDLTLYFIVAVARDVSVWKRFHVNWL